MAQVLEDSFTFPLLVKRTVDGLYTVEAAGLNLGKTGEDLAQLEASMRAAVAEILAVSARHSLETMQASGPMGQMHTESHQTEGAIMRWARVALVIFVLSLLVGLGVRETILSKFEISGDGNAMAKGLARMVAKTAQILESVTPDRRNEVTTNLHRIAISLQPYALQMRPVWTACCAPQSRPYPSSAQDEGKKTPGAPKETKGNSTQSDR